MDGELGVYVHARKNGKLNKIKGVTDCVLGTKILFHLYFNKALRHPFWKALFLLSCYQL